MSSTAPRTPRKKSAPAARAVVHRLPDGFAPSAGNALAVLFGVELVEALQRRRSDGAALCSPTRSTNAADGAACSGAGGADARAFRAPVGALAPVQELRGGGDQSIFGLGQHDAGGCGGGLGVGWCGVRQYRSG